MAGNVTCLADRSHAARTTQRTVSSAGRSLQTATSLRHTVSTARTPQSSGNGTAYLVAENEVGAFADRVRALQAEQPDADLSCTGPWPPYSFMGVA